MTTKNDVIAIVDKQRDNIQRHINDENAARTIEHATFERGAIGMLKSKRHAALVYDKKRNAFSCIDGYEVTDNMRGRIERGEVRTYSVNFFFGVNDGVSHITQHYVRETIADYMRYDETALSNWGVHIDKTHYTLIDIKADLKRGGIDVSGDMWRAMLDALSFDSLADHTCDEICAMMVDCIMSNTSDVDSDGELPLSIESIFERHDMSVCSSSEHDGAVCFELEAYTDSGGDIIHTIWLNADEVSDKKAWKREFSTMYDEYDPWHEAHMWMDEEGNPVNTPFDNGYDLYMDYVSYRNDTLKSINDELQKVA